MLKVSAQAREPKIEPWGHCHSPYTCEFWDHCTDKKPTDWIFYLPRLREKQGTLLRSKGIEAISRIPRDVVLTSQQAIIRNAHRTGRPCVSPDLGKALRKFGPPACFLDFETMSPAIPIYPGTRPYERIPFQWSLHTLGRSGDLQHTGFLADGRGDPREEFTTSLIQALGSSAVPIVVYSHFERSTLEQLAKTLKRHVKPIGKIVLRLRDLLVLLREHVYYPEFGGSYSIKDVAPVLAADVRYDDLEHVADGGAAAWAFERIATGRCDGNEELLRRALEEVEN